MGKIWEKFEPNSNNSDLVEKKSGQFRKRTKQCWVAFQKNKNKKKHTEINKTNFLKSRKKNYDWLDGRMDGRTDRQWKGVGWKRSRIRKIVDNNTTQVDSTVNNPSRKIEENSISNESLNFWWKVLSEGGFEGEEEKTANKYWR